MPSEFDVEKGSKVLSPTKLAHVVLRTNNPGPMISFYKTFLGAYERYCNEFLSFLSYDDEHHRIAIVTVPDITPKNPSTCGLEHIAFTYENARALLLSYRQRLANGISPTWCVNHGMTLSIYYNDPDGNTIETQVDTFPTVEEATAFMESEPFRINPLGVDFNPEEVITRLEAGEVERKILERPDIGPRSLDTVPGFG